MFTVLTPDKPHLLEQARIYELIQKYQDHTITQAEKHELMDWYQAVSHSEAGFPEEEAAVKVFMHDRLMQSIQVKRVNYIRRYWAVAASVLLLLSAGAYFIMTKSPPAGRYTVNNTGGEIGPGADKAILTLSDGAKISLTDAVKGRVASQGGISITKSAAGEIVYTIQPAAGSDSNGAAGAGVLYNILSTPAGGQFQVVLPDGTHVWLNALSSLRFPVKFSPRQQRRVYLTGEAYFEVAHDADAPFSVETARQQVEVLGTHFNINAYPDEEFTNTTLLQGAVRLTAEQGSIRLKPGQQAYLKERFNVSEVDTEYAVAWKNGLFRFDDQRLENIMKVIARWYNVTVFFDDQAMKEELFGVFSTRFANISALLNILEQTGNAHFTVQGSTIHITRKK